MTEKPASEKKDKRFLKQSVYEMEAFSLPNERTRRQSSETAQEMMQIHDQRSESNQYDSDVIDANANSAQSPADVALENWAGDTQSIYEINPFVISGEFEAPRTNAFDALQNQPAPAPDFESTADQPTPLVQPIVNIRSNDKEKEKEKNAITLELTTGRPDARVGTRVGQYEIVDVIGRGNMAVVYKARHMHTNEIVALKTHRVDADESQKARFAREIDTHSRLAHENIVQYIHSLHGPDGQQFLAIENVRGLSLQAVLDTHGPIHHPLNIWSIFTQICDALEHAHKRGVIHRDLKPGNVILSKKSGQRIQVKLADFGIAHDEMDLARLTQEGSSIGSPLYMSPEQCQGFDLTPRSDVYSLAILMTETVSGVCPYRGKSIMSIIRAHCNPMTKPEPLSSFCPELPCVSELEKILEKALETEEEKRYQSAAELKQALNDWFEKTVATKAISSVTLPKLTGEEAVSEKPVVEENLKQAFVQPTVEKTSSVEKISDVVPLPVETAQNKGIPTKWIVIIAILFLLSNAMTAYCVCNWNKIQPQANTTPETPENGLSTSIQADR